MTGKRAKWRIVNDGTRVEVRGKDGRYSVVMDAKNGIYSSRSVAGLVGTANLLQACVNEEPTREMMDAAVDAYVATMDPELRGGLVPDAVRQGMWPALKAALTLALSPDLPSSDHQDGEMP